MNIVDDIKSIAGVVQKIGNIDLYKKILDLQGEALDLLASNVSLSEENRHLKNTLKVKDALSLRNNAYWTNRDDKEDGPFCTRCWDADQKLIRMLPGVNPAYYQCPNCKCDLVNVKPELNSSPPASPAIHF